jgi:hypothetical protein
MRLSIATCLVALSIISLPAGVHAGGRGREAEAPYQTPVIGASVHFQGETTAYYYDCLSQIGCAILRVKSGERFADLEVEDAAGTPVLASVYTMPGGNHIGDFCGSTDKPIPTFGAHELLVHVVNGVCPDESTPSVVTSGIVRATFFKKGP